ncbi:hypothetical protein V3589_32385, partial [Sinorhizobium fredii]|uniref:hypothetical protein n=1 Tax=Rhizobium fredii TaxID=380 RepID=UPI00309C16D3
NTLLAKSNPTVVICIVNAPLLLRVTGRHHSGNRRRGGVHIIKGCEEGSLEPPPRTRSDISRRKPDNLSQPQVGW